MTLLNILHQLDLKSIGWFIAIPVGIYITWMLWNVEHVSYEEVAKRAVEKAKREEANTEYTGKVMIPEQNKRIEGYEEGIKRFEI